MISIHPFPLLDSHTLARFLLLSTHYRYVLPVVSPLSQFCVSTSVLTFIKTTYIHPTPPFHTKDVFFPFSYTVLITTYKILPPSVYGQGCSVDMLYTGMSFLHFISAVKYTVYMNTVTTKIQNFS